MQNTSLQRPDKALKRHRIVKSNLFTEKIIANFIVNFIGLELSKNIRRPGGSVTSKKSPNVYKKWPKNDFTRKLKDFDSCIKLPLNVVNLGKIIVDAGFEKLPKVQ